MPRRLATLALCTVLALAGLAGCDSDPGSVEDFDIQPLVRVSASNLVFTQGQTTLPTFTVTYQGIDEAPELEAGGAFALERIEESGSPSEGGSQIWQVDYTEELPSGESAQDSVFIRSVGDARSIRRTLSVRVNNPITILQDFSSPFAAVNDFEDDQRAVTTADGASVETVSGPGAVAEGSTGLNALRVNTGGGDGAVTLERQTNAPDQEILSFLIQSEAATDFTLTVTLTDETEDDAETFDFAVPVPAGDGWRQVSIDVSQTAGFDPVAERAGGDGPLQSVTFTADQDVTFVLDDVAFGTASGPTIEVNDFEEPNLAYGGIGQSNVSDVADEADGPTARRFTYTGDGSFGYNYQADGPALFLDGTSEGYLSMYVGGVSQAFDLRVFVETAGSTFNYDSGMVLSVEAGEGFREVRVPFSDLGGDPSALGREEGITNIGFVVNRTADDDSDDPIEFTLDGIKLHASN